MRIGRARNRAERSKGPGAKAATVATVELEHNGCRWALSASAVSELLALHHQLSKDWAEVEALLRRLAPVWVEMRGRS